MDDNPDNGGTDVILNFIFFIRVREEGIPSDVFEYSSSGVVISFAFFFKQMGNLVELVNDVHVFGIPTVEFFPLFLVHSE